MVEPAIRRHFDALKCSICYRWPITTCYRACYQDHADFTCMECLDEQYDTANNENRERCPSCRGQLIPRESRGPDVMRNLLMDSLKVWCTNRRRRDDGSWEGCAEMVLLSGMISHREHCRFQSKAANGSGLDASESTGTWRNTRMTVSSSEWTAPLLRMDAPSST